MTDHALVVWAIFLLTLAVTAFGVWQYTMLTNIDRAVRRLDKALLGVKDEPT